MEEVAGRQILLKTRESLIQVIVRQSRPKNIEIQTLMMVLIWSKKTMEKNTLVVPATCCMNKTKTRRMGHKQVLQERRVQQERKAKRKGQRRERKRARRLPRSKKSKSKMSWCHASSVESSQPSSLTARN